MTGLGQFRVMAEKHGICEMAREWDACKSKKQLMDLALTIRGTQYLWKAMREGWGPSQELIQNEFAPFINGGYIRRQDGYTSAIYCGVNPNEITVDTTVALIIGHKGDIIIPRNHLCEIYLYNCDAHIICYGMKATVYSDGGSVTTDSPNVEFSDLK